MNFGGLAPALRRAVAVLHRLLWLPLLIAACVPTTTQQTALLPDPAPVPEPVVQPVSAYTQMLRDYGIPLDIPQRGKFIFVNVPSFELIAFEDGEPVMRSRVVVGRPSTETPDLFSYLYALKFNPDWTPTPMMIRNEAAEYVPPGPNNPLGRLKFEMDNNQFIYLHDTNRKELFNRDRRAYSHGCVRVQNYLDLAAWVAGVPVEEIERKIRTGRTFTERVPEAVPVYLGYYIFFPNEYGQLTAYPDLYGRGGRVPNGYYIVSPATNDTAAVIAPAVEGMSYPPQPVSVARPAPPPRPSAPTPRPTPAPPTPTPTPEEVEGTVTSDTDTPALVPAIETGTASPAVSEPLETEPDAAEPAVDEPAEAPADHPPAAGEPSVEAPPLEEPPVEVPVVEEPAIEPVIEMPAGEPEPADAAAPAADPDEPVACAVGDPACAAAAAP